MSYDLWKTRDPNDTGFYDMPEDDGPTELDIAYQRIEALVKAAQSLIDEISTRGTHERWKTLANLLHDPVGGASKP